MEIYAFIAGIALGICITCVIVVISLVKELLHLKDD